jgi:hypothetical protein
MIVVADTGPIHYLVIVEAVNVLKSLYGRVLVPQTVAGSCKELGRRTRFGPGSRNRRSGVRSGPTRLPTLPCSFSIPANARRSRSRCRWTPAAS